MYRLKKALYGLEQSHQAWFGRFHKAMVNFGYRRSDADPTMFVKRANGKITILIFM